MPVHPRKFYVPVTNLLQEDKTDWQGMRRVGEIRRELAMKTPLNPDSLYKVREQRVQGVGGLVLLRAGVVVWGFD